MYQVVYDDGRGILLYGTYWLRSEADDIVNFLKKQGNRAWVRVVHGDHNT